MNRTTTVLLTFDYEVFMRIPGTVKQCMLLPTERILAALDAHDVRATFFVDTCFLLRLRGTGRRSADLDAIEAQLRAMVSRGHRIELHLHTSWLDATFDDGRLSPGGLGRYRVHQLDPADRDAVFADSLDLLHAVGASVRSDYRVACFRAGGYCVQPFSELRPLFEKHGLWVDSSVAPGLRAGTPPFSFDFRGAPAKEAYRFGDDPLTEDARGPFLEVPVTTIGWGPLDRLRERRLRRAVDPEQASPMGDGRGIEIEGRWDPLSKFRREVGPLSVEGRRGLFVNRQMRRAPRAVYCIISHPKNMGPAHFRALDELCGNPYRFLTLPEFAEQRPDRPGGPHPRSES